MVPFSPQLDDVNATIALFPGEQSWDLTSADALDQNEGQPVPIEYLNELAPADFVFKRI